MPAYLARILAGLEDSTCPGAWFFSEAIMICRHCHQARVNRPRGLCWSCYYRPGVRDKYPSTSKFARRGVGNFCGIAPLPLRPTAALPGSPEKVAVLEERARLKQSLWHADDARFENGIVVGAQRARAG